MPDKPHVLPLRDKLLYSAGYFGVSILSGLFLAWVNFRYDKLFSGAEGKVVVALVLLGGRLLDAPSDPLVGWWSDRTKSRLGRRKPFILFGTLPLIIAFALIWVHPAGVDSHWNTLWLLVTCVAYFTLFSVVVNPYLAMLPDIARSEDDRVALSSLVAAFGLVAEAAALIGAGLLMGAAGFGSAVGIGCAVAFVCLMLPLFVREASSPQEQEPPKFGLVEAVREALASRPFRTFLVSKALFWVAMRTILAVSPFFVAGVLGLTEEREIETQHGLLMAFALLPAFGWYAGMKWLTRRLSRRGICLWGLGVLTGVSALMVTVGALPIPPLWHARVLLVLGSFPLAVIFAVPDAILAELVDLDERVTGCRREAIYFGAQGFFVKVSWGGAAALVMLFRAVSPNDPMLTSRLAWATVALVSLVALAVFARFPRDRELQAMQSFRPEDP